ncbi:MAG: V-type ATP synthase subunit D [Candidatus Heimdallarchaeota archaeon]|nr:V-type ATP synthase subunit D [Candidatus Heimdallarchaeota archaeon]
MSSDKIDNISPTRMALLELRNKIKLATHGHDLLKEKNDALIMEFYEVLEEIKEARTSSEEALDIAHSQLKLASIKMGVLKLKEIGFSAPEILTLKTSTRSIMGVKTPKLSLVKREVSKPFYGSEFTSIALDHAINAFRDYTYAVVNLAEKVATLQKLAYEISSTKRRVNALNHIIIPRLSNTAVFIDLALEEEDREQFSRMKFIKKKLTENSAEEKPEEVATPA